MVVVQSKLDEMGTADGNESHLDLPARLLYGYLPLVPRSRRRRCGLVNTRTRCCIWWLTEDETRFCLMFVRIGESGLRSEAASGRNRKRVGLHQADHKLVETEGACILVPICVRFDLQRARILSSSKRVRHHHGTCAHACTRPRWYGSPCNADISLNTNNIAVWQFSHATRQRDDCFQMARRVCRTLREGAAVHGTEYHVDEAALASQREFCVTSQHQSLIDLGTLNHTSSPARHGHDMILGQQSTDGTPI